MAGALDCGSAGFARDDGGAEFWNQPDGHRAELIDGILYDVTPPGTAHQRLSRDLLMQLGSFIRETGGPCEVFSAPFAVRVTPDDRNWFEPDLTVVCDPSKISERGCEAAPDLVVEIVSPRPSVAITSPRRPAMRRVAFASIGSWTPLPAIPRYGASTPKAWLRAYTPLAIRCRWASGTGRAR